MDIKEYNGTSLAYMGDAVMSLLVREMLLAQGWQKSKILQKKSESWVSAKVTTYRMSTGLEALFGWLYLTHQEDRLKALWEEIQKIGEYQ